MRTCTSPRRRSAGLRRAAQVLALACALAAAPSSAGVTKQWYLFRARANMEIRNYRAAVEAYRKALEHDADDREALRGLADAYEANGQTDEAIGAYDRYLAKHPDDVDVAFKQARALGWSRYAYRRADAIRYYRMGLDRRDDPTARHELAKLLSQQKSDLPAAVEQYRILLKERPADAALRAEYRKLLLWDKAFLADAIEEYSALAEARPNDMGVRLQLARLLAQDPRRTGEAIDAYEKVLASGNRSPPVRLEYARLLARDPSRRRDALVELRPLVSEKSDFETRKLYADLLSAEDETRDEALDQYASLVSARPKDASLRLGYARLLGAEKASSRAAIAQYERVIAAQPRNAEAHAGLARAWAWNGDNDRALHHGRLAREYGARAEDVRTLEASLGMGREPRAGAGFSAVVQPSEEYALYGFRVPALGRTELSAFVTAWAQAGAEHYWGGLLQTATGAFAGVGTEVRFSPSARATFGLDWQSLRPGASGVGGRAEVEFRGEGFKIAPRFERGPRTDSFEALTGGVTSNRLQLAYERRFGAWRAQIVPGVALISGGGEPVNAQLTLDASAELEVARGPSWRLAVGIDSQTSHYGEAGFGGTYYNPALHSVQTPRVSFEHRVDGEHLIEVSGGPALQYEVPYGAAGGFLAGGQARANASFRLGESLELNVGGAFVRTGAAYSRFDALTSLSYVF